MPFVLLVPFHSCEERDERILKDQRHTWGRRTMIDEEIPFQTVCTVDAIPDGEGRAFPVNGMLVAVFRRGDQYFAINDSCPHMGASLASGYLEGCDVICPWHAWKFCVKDGLWMDNPKSKVRTDSYAVRVIDDDVQVEIPMKRQSE